MREESHLDDMRAAIRGDFERLAERLGGQELMRSREFAAEPEQESPAEAQVADDDEQLPPDAQHTSLAGEADEQPVPDLSQAPEDPPQAPQPVPDSSQAPDVPAEPVEPEEPHRSFLDRLFGR